ncbi:hypothetical protein Zm00014a_029529 [Zea mays]|uniref:Uncharacterized protein n=2 Tax=Zea mays TaxID=4577 RepID=A0A8J8XGX7_MAIZE|nr:hypothetical protein [Zea mays]PWZ15420.1 hypothetical protein Zm00014a_029529 [Zea mays]
MLACCFLNCVTVIGWFLLPLFCPFFFLFSFLLPACC